ncbi:MAG TPA: acyl carrier protein [Arenicellales bacterium]|nr:acyl carrier protein [Arenicellales bacterium]
MTQDEARQLIARLYRRIAPDVDFEDIDPDADFREQAEIDSMDFFNFVVALKRETGFEMPETDYGRVDTLNRAAEYLAEVLPDNQPAPPAAGADSTSS